ncbi:hypothetical protein V6N12_045237 [Hibiscus sabdariffa]|uniref:RNase H type-1 domain-containing protein n=1 Tax=Hibiscus sabdariffa TaxID=183260 RepID=A0ABR2G268_9ROSI
MTSFSQVTASLFLISIGLVFPGLPTLRTLPLFGHLLLRLDLSLSNGKRRCVIVYALILMLLCLFLSAWAPLGVFYRILQVCGLRGFASLLALFPPLQAELWIILVGLQLAWSMGISRLQVQSDNSVVVRLVLDSMASTSTSPLVHAIAMLSNRDWSIEFIWVPREQNMVVDSLSKFFPNLHYNLTVLDDAPEFSRPILIRDRDCPPYYQRSLSESSSTVP